MRIVWIALFIIVVSIPRVAKSQSVILTVEDLQSVCEPALQFLAKEPESRTADEAVQLVRCLGYTEGVVSTVVRLSVAGFMVDPLYENTFCFPETTEPSDWVRSFVSWAESNPERSDTPAVDGFLLALIKAYPCQGAEGSDAAPEPQ